eukprot:jgi/Botrbrau1/4995/Bobra.0396s0021.1
MVLNRSSTGVRQLPMGFLLTIFLIASFLNYSTGAEQEARSITSSAQGTNRTSDNSNNLIQPGASTAGTSGGAPYLTTVDGPEGKRIVDASGTEITLHGVGWYGFNIGLTISGNLTGGKTAVARDWKQIVYRMKMLGFNAIRLPFSFDDVNGLGQPPINYQGVCAVPSTDAIKETLVPPSYPQSAGPLAGTSLPSQAPPAVTGNMCNTALPNNSTYKRFVWVVRYLAQQGFYISLDYHSNKWGGSGDQSVFNRRQWVANWVALLKNILALAPEAQGRLLIDLMNEPDGFDLTWEGNETLAGLGTYYIEAIDAMYQICPGCLFLIEGTGQSKWKVKLGQRFRNRPGTLDFPGGPCAPRVLPSGLGAQDSFAGHGLWNSLSKSFGYLTTTGYCDPNTQRCTRFAAIMDEFGSTFQNEVEKQCFNSIVMYMNNAGEANDRQHTSIKSWFYWAWNAESFGTGGLVADNQETIVWEKINALTGGTLEYPTGLGLTPWYLAAFNDVQGTIRGAPAPVGDTTVGEVVPAPSVSTRDAVLANLPPGVVTFLPPPLPQDGGRAYTRVQKQQIVGDSGGGDDGPTVYMPTTQRAEQLIGSGSSASDLPMSTAALRPVALAPAGVATMGGASAPAGAALPAPVQNAASLSGLTQPREIICGEAK